ncbi:MAG: hypothetical protein JSW07_06420 [bacterium]|nr:MAG: hypothetical protein JSW07_06420 [bacterium]
MVDVYKKQIKNLEKRIHIFKLIFIISIILLIIGVIGFTAFMIRNYQLRQELDQMKMEQPENLEESLQRLDEINNELDFMNNTQPIFAILMMGGTLFSSISYSNRKRFLKLKELYSKQNGTEPELSFIVDQIEDNTQ